jgi:hypothetical protein
MNSGFSETMAADVSDGTVIGRVALKNILNVIWPTYLLNEMHMQIKFILEESGFLDLQCNGFNWMLHHNGKVYPIVLRPYIPFIIGNTEGHDRLLVIIQLVSAPSSNYVECANVPPLNLDTLRQSIPTESQLLSIGWSESVTWKG